MSKSYFVFSTLANDQKYVDWSKPATEGQLPVEQGSVVIKGGFGMMNDRFVTSMGVRTEVTEEQMAMLQRNPGYLAHLKAGFLTVHTKPAEAEKVAADMNRADGSLPLTPAEYTAGSPRVRGSDARPNATA